MKASQVLHAILYTDKFLLGVASCVEVGVIVLRMSAPVGFLGR